jgi:carbon monoxide dehydrogenase subunit G
VWLADEKERNDMASIRKEVSVQASPEHVWEAIRDVNAVHRRLAPGFVLDVRPDGEARIVTFANGAVVRELIVDVDDKARRIAYAVVDSPLQLTHHHATMEVLRDGADASRIVWIADVSPGAAAGQVGSMMEQGSLVMKQSLERTAPRPEPQRA